MKASEYFGLLTAIYLAPQLSHTVGIIAALLFIFCGCVSIHREFK